jgi:Fe-S cluster assembly ATPase SufC
MSRTYGPEERAKLERIIKEGIGVLQEVEDLQTSLKDTVKHIAEELDIKPALINKAIRVAKSGDWSKRQDEFAELEALVEIVGANNEDE